MSIGRIRIQRSDLPETPTPCALSIPCVYRDAQGVCDDPRINKANGDSACHTMSNKAVLEALKP